MLSLADFVTYSFALSFIYSTIHRFIYSFIHLSSAFYRPGTVLASKDSKMNPLQGISSISSSLWDPVANQTTDKSPLVAFRAQC